MNFLKEDYYNNEKKFYDILLSSIGEDIYLYCVTGSLGREDVIPNWSDIDILLVIKEYNELTLSCINSCLLKISGDIKIGVTIFSLEEFNHEYLKDAKTYISIELILKGYYKPRIMLPEVELILEDKTLKKYMDISSFSRFSHDIKRELLRMKDDYDEKKVYKLIIILLKIMLNQKGIVALNYQNTLLESIKHLQNFKIDIPEPVFIMDHPEEKSKRFFIYLSFLEWLRKNTNVIFQ